MSSLVILMLTATLGTQSRTCCDVSNRPFLRVEVPTIFSSVVSLLFGEAIASVFLDVTVDRPSPEVSRHKGIEGFDISPGNLAYHFLQV